MVLRISKTYNEAAEKTGKLGRMYGIEGDIRKKVVVASPLPMFPRTDVHLSVRSKAPCS